MLTAFAIHSVAMCSSLASSEAVDLDLAVPGELMSSSFLVVLLLL
jgi:hypothetical protein